MHRFFACFTNLVSQSLVIKASQNIIKKNLCDRYWQVPRLHIGANIVQISRNKVISVLLESVD